MSKSVYPVYLNIINGEWIIEVNENFWRYVQIVNRQVRLVDGTERQYSYPVHELENIQDRIDDIENYLRELPEEPEFTTEIVAFTLNDWHNGEWNKIGS